MRLDSGLLLERLLVAAKRLANSVQNASSTEAAPIAELLLVISEAINVSRHRRTDLSPEETTRLAAILDDLEYRTDLKPSDVGRIRSELAPLLKPA